MRPASVPANNRNLPFQAALLLCLAGAAVTPARADLVHRWSFDPPGGGAPDGTKLFDSISAAVATVRGQGSTFGDGALILPGWSRPFDFGRVTGSGSGGGAPGKIIDLEGTAPGTTTPFDNLAMSFCRGNDIDQNANTAFHELRIYDHPLSAAEIAANLAAGPETLGEPLEPVDPPVTDHRWTFNTPAAAEASSGTSFPDDLGGATATLQGNGGSLSGSSLVLPGTTNPNQPASTISAYLDLPNGFISSRTDVTIEAWITPLSSQNWQRVFDFGNSSVTYGPGALPGEHRLEGKLNGGSTTTVDTDLSSITETDTEHHFVLTAEDGAVSFGSNGRRVRWFRDSVLQGSLDLGFRLPDLDDVNNWIGRSLWSDDRNSHMSINELRVYDRAISAGEISASFDAGADSTFPPPVAVADAVTIHPRSKVMIDVLTNDTGEPLPSSVEIVTPPAAGTATVQPTGKILYVHDGSDTSEITFTYRASGIGGLSEPGTVSVSVSHLLRIPSPEFNVPVSPPETEIALVDAFPGVTFVNALCFASPPDDIQRLFVCEIDGVLKVIPDTTAANPTSSVVLDLNGAISNPPRSPAESIQRGDYGECGLLSVAFHPDFAANGHFYVFYSVVKSGTASFFQRVSRFTIPAAQIDDPSPVADPASELILIDQYDSGSNHQGGDMHFGPDGYLYISVGDEQNPYDVYLNSQRIDRNLFAGLLRIDVDKLPDNPEPNDHPAVPKDGGVARYSIPADNPWIGATEFISQPVDPADVRTEFFAVGLRSPWRFWIDPETEDIWLGDVGQDRYEELNLIESGGNYGWVFREGAHDINTFRDGWPDKPVDFNSLAIDPVYEYVHTGMSGDPAFKGNSIIGGRVYRGARISSLSGSYIFGDQVSGHIWAMNRSGENFSITRIGGQPWLSNFGADPANGDILVSDFFGGRIMRLVSTTAAGTFPTTLGDTGLFADLSDLSPSPGVLPYQPNVTFWSDHATKQRWFTIPDPSATMTYHQDDPWDYPDGQIWIKHFDLETRRGDPTSSKRLETRLLVRNDAGVYGVSYRWNDEETEATLVEDAGVSFPVEIDIDGTPNTQTWQIPSRAQCITCHNPQAGHALSFNTRQLNRDHFINGFSGNQIELLDLHGYITNGPDTPADQLPRHVDPDDTTRPLEARARTYLDVNCAYCHQPGGGGGTGWDGRASLTLEQSGMIFGDVAAAKQPDDKLVTPGNSLRSVILSRISQTDGYTRMPPLATNIHDEEAIALITAWIEAELPGRKLYEQWRDTHFAALDPDGDRNADPDGDGHSNRDEYLLGSPPLSANPAGQPAITGDPSLRFLRKAFRKYDILTSSDLATWDRWEVPQNHSQYLTEDAWEEIPVDITDDDARFFRIEISEP